MPRPTDAIPERRPAARRRRTRAAVVALALAALLATGCATLDRQQRQWIFQPGERTWWGGQAAAEGMQERWIGFHSRITGDPVRLHALWLPQPDPAAPALLFLHGARYDVRGSAPRMRRLHALGFAVLAVDYRGFGRSSAALPSEAMALEDARAAWDDLAAAHPQARRLIFGHSLGGALAVQLAAAVGDEAGLMVEGSFPSIAEVVRATRWGWLPVAPLITQKLDAGAHIAAVGSPVLVVHGEQDRVIAPELGRRLYERAQQPKRFVLVPGGSHHSTNALAQPQYRMAMDTLFGLAAGAGGAVAGPAPPLLR
jgi:alpha-beta hydrolase superfamily lysophospholipase